MNLSELVGLSFLPFNATNTKVHQELTSQCALTRKILPLCFIMLTALHCGLLPVVNNLGDYQFTVVYIKENFGIWSLLFQVLYYICILSSGYSIGSLCSVSIYIGMHLKFQFHLLATYLQQISYGIGSNKDAVSYQGIIQKRLTSFVQSHVKIKT